MIKKIFIAAIFVISILFNTNNSYGFSMFNFNDDNTIVITYLSDTELLVNNKNYRYFGDKSYYIWILEHPNILGRFGSDKRYIEVEYFIHKVNINTACINNNLYKFKYRNKLCYRQVIFTRIDGKCTDSSFH